MSQLIQGIQVDRLVRSKRRTIAIEIDMDGSLVVRAPLHASQDEIDALLLQRKEWIKGKLSLADKFAREAPPKQFSVGEQFLYLGHLYALEIVENQADPLVLRDAFRLAAHAREHARQVFIDWYRGQAKQVISERAARLAGKHSFSSPPIRITSAKSRWGSCGTKGRLNFPWRLVMAPEEVIDYVILHELAHLRVRNHSRAYWDVVRRLSPDYKVHRKWLHENGHRLSLD